MFKSTVFAAALVVAMSTPALGSDTWFGGLGDMVMKGRAAFKDTIPSQDAALEADGGNPRVYFFTPPDNQGVTCFFIAGTQKGGSACYPKAQK